MSDLNPSNPNPTNPSPSGSGMNPTPPPAPTSASPQTTVSQPVVVHTATQTPMITTMPKSPVVMPDVSSAPITTPQGQHEHQTISPAPAPKLATPTPQTTSPQPNLTAPVSTAIPSPSPVVQQPSPQSTIQTTTTVQNSTPPTPSPATAQPAQTTFAAAQAQVPPIAPMAPQQPNLQQAGQTATAANQAQAQTSNDFRPGDKLAPTPEAILKKIASNQPQTDKRPDGTPLEAEEKIFSALGYIGILALLPLLAKRDSEFCQHHGRQGLVVAIIFIFLWMLAGMSYSIAVLVFILQLVAIAGGFLLAYKGDWFRIPAIYELSLKLDWQKRLQTPQ